MAASDDEATRIGALVAALKMRPLESAVYMNDGDNSSWISWADKLTSGYADEIVDYVDRSVELRILALHAGIITIEQALAMPGDLSALFGDRELIEVFQARLEVTSPGIFEGLAAVGRFIGEHPRLPWVRAALYDGPLPTIATEKSDLSDEFGMLDEFAGLGVAAAIALGCELSSLRPLRRTYGLSEIPMPARFKELFQDWAGGRVDFVEIIDE
jgi:hypothetical protein